MGRRVSRHMIDVGFIDRVRGGIAIHDVLKGGVVEFWGLPPLIPLLQFVNRLGFEICSVNRMNNRTRKLGYVNLNWPRCSALLTESLALTDGSLC